MVMRRQYQDNMGMIKHEMARQLKRVYIENFQNRDQDNPEESGEEDVSTDLVSQVDAASALELELRCIEHHAAAAPTDVMFMRRWRNITSSSRFSFLRQKKNAGLRLSGGRFSVSALDAERFETRFYRRSAVILAWCMPAPPSRVKLLYI
ncbi:hypothetical protein AVEN_151408-1 [Araneus ventricosus]|uniref:Uncharacterized protein n=1 Tax=Araneus ventricosus TaxID=182803 RepID=A0A4Y2CB45_ARAVE|nr:hypothetical protein AVEN_151408-1 [Araneus ventricosus]